MSEPVGDGNQAKIIIDTYKGRKAVIKTALHPEIPVLSELEQWMIQREGRALRRLQSVEGVPDFLGVPDQYSIAMEYCPGTLLRNVDPDLVREGFFQDLEVLVRAIHERGVVHADLKRKENIMIDEEGNPIIIDFGTHLIDKNGFRPVNGFLYDQFRRMDLNAVSKLKKNFCPDAVTQTDRDRLESPTILERADRFRRNYIWDW